MTIAGIRVTILSSNLRISILHPLFSRIFERRFVLAIEFDVEIHAGRIFVALSRNVTNCFELSWHSTSHLFSSFRVDISDPLLLQTFARNNDKNLARLRKNLAKFHRMFQTRCEGIAHLLRLRKEYYEVFRSRIFLEVRDGERQK